MTRREKNDTKRNNAMRIASIIAISVFILSVIILGIYIYSMLNRMKYNPEEEIPVVTETPEPLPTYAEPTPTMEPTPTPDLTPKSNEEYGVINIMIFGVDNRYKNSYSGRSDVNIVLTLDTVNKEVRMTSILRDTLIYLPAQQDYNRINAAIVYEEGPDGAVAAIEDAFRIDIDHYMITSFRKVAKIIDAVGGVNVYLTQNETWALNGLLQEMNLLYGYAREKDMLSATGNVHLTGLQAVAYMRIRHIDSDNERANRQMEVFKNMKERLKDADLKAFNNLMDTVTSNVKTDMEPLKLLEVAKVLYDLRNGGFRTAQAPFEGYYEQTYYHDMSVFKVNSEKTNELLHNFIYEGIDPQ